jgi:RNA polymerase sigma factor (sigma-70 family)
MECVLSARDVIGPEPALGLLEDEQLVRLVRDSGYLPARDELLARSSRQRVNLVCRLARDTGLSDADRADALQEAVLWTLEAIQNYHGKSFATAGRCSFRSFLHRVIACRFIDFLRHRLRYQRHFVHIGGTLPSDLDRFFDPSSPGGSHPEVSERMWEVEEGESNARLQQQLDRLGVRTRRLWQLLAQGASVVQISATLHISYDSAKRRRRKLLIQLRKSLKVG